MDTDMLIFIPEWNRNLELHSSMMRRGRGKICFDNL